MGTKKTIGLEKILIAFALSLFVFSIAFAACDITRGNIIFSKTTGETTKGCTGDEVAAAITNIQGCRGTSYNAYYFTFNEDVIPGFEPSSQVNRNVWSTGSNEGDLCVNNAYYKKGKASVQWNAKPSSPVNCKDENHAQFNKCYSDLYLQVDDWNGEPRNDWTQYELFEVWIWSDSAQSLCIDPTDPAGNRMKCWKIINLKANDWTFVSLDLNTLRANIRSNVKEIRFWDEGDADSFTLYLDGLRLIERTGDKVELSSGKLDDNIGAFLFDVPAVTGKIKISFETAGSVLTKEFESAGARPTAEECYALHDEYVDCAQKCDEKPFERIWTQVLSSSIPMHFTFAMQNALDLPNVFAAQEELHLDAYLDPTIGCGSETFGLASQANSRTVFCGSFCEGEACGEWSGYASGTTKVNSCSDVGCEASCYDSVQRRNPTLDSTKIKSSSYCGEDTYDRCVGDSGRFKDTTQAQTYVDCCDILTLDCSCRTCEKIPSNSPFWKAAPSTEQDTVYGTDVGWNGIYYEAQSDGTALVTPPNILDKGEIVASEFADSGCSGTAKCTYEVHNVTRYTYSWEIEYDVVTTAYSEEEYIPMYVGYDQEPPPDKVSCGSYCEEGTACGPAMLIDDCTDVGCVETCYEQETAKGRDMDYLTQDLVCGLEYNKCIGSGGYYSDVEAINLIALKAKGIAGSCEGDNICYTEVPLCGDGVCDIAAGERCWNCREDCFGPPDSDKGWEGDCTSNSQPGYEGTTEHCSRCPVVEGTDVADDRGCIIRYKQESETCNCNAGECGKGNPLSHIGGTQEQLSCVFKDVDNNVMDEGRCCHNDEVWNGTHCVVPRKLSARNLRITKVQESHPRDWIPEICCGDSRKDAVWLDVQYDVVNEGGAAETFTTKIRFPQENTKPELTDRMNAPFITDEQGAYEYDAEWSFEDFQPRDSTGEKTNDRVACAFDQAKYCKTENFYYQEDAQGYVNRITDASATPNTEIVITIDAEHIDTYPEAYFNGHNYPSILRVEGMTCETKKTGGIANCVSDGSDEIKIAIIDQNLIGPICGGWAVPDQMNKYSYVKKYFDRKSWILAYDLEVAGLGCGLTPWPHTYCIGGLCYVDCYYEGCS